MNRGEKGDKTRRSAGSGFSQQGASAHPERSLEDSHLQRVCRTDRFKKAFLNLEDKTIQKRVLKALLLLDSNLQHPSLQIKGVQGTEGIWEARVTDKYRMTFEIKEGKCILRNLL
jgi:mRNA-degrading endonuclease RelE of RelBE toxin-antitoxin system